MQEGRRATGHEYRRPERQVWQGRETGRNVIESAGQVDSASRLRRQGRTVGKVSRPGKQADLARGAARQVGQERHCNGWTNGLKGRQAGWEYRATNRVTGDGGRQAGMAEEWWRKVL